MVTANIQINDIIVPFTNVKFAPCVLENKKIDYFSLYMNGTKYGEYNIDEYTAKTSLLAAMDDAADYGYQGICFINAQ